MAKEYYEKLSRLLIDADIKKEVEKPMEVKHFFSGAALYVGQSICASLTPVGLAFKLPEKEVDALIKSGEAIPLKYFPRGHVKKGYALFQKPDEIKPEQLRKYFIRSARQV
ncbi:MAG TPA: hypothetical protein ENJ87_02060 [Gammaproteobacteria bacterium]|nr:hypothetical protein [Gammaproteobacteria bacterium]